MSLLDEIKKAQADAVVRVINGGMRENLLMAQVRAGEDVVIASVERMRARLNPAGAPPEAGEEPGARDEVDDADAPPAG
jgi:hypothetical protein